MSNRKIIVTLAIVLALAFIGCDNGGDDKTHTHDYSATWTKNATQHWHECSCGDKKDVADHQWQWVVTTPATATAEGLETETCATCGATNGTRPIEQTEPADREFTVNFEFQNPGDPVISFNIIIMDTRTACGSTDLEHMEVGNKNIVTIIEEAIQGAFSNVATTNGQRGRFRNVFGDNGNDVIIIVDNPSTAYKLKAPDESTIYFHIDYLKSSPSDIQQKIFDAVTAMNTGGASLPYEAE
jgi:hypothetical protein